MYDNRVNTNFPSKKVPKGDASYKCLSLIMLDSIVKVGKKVLSTSIFRGMQIC